MSYIETIDVARAQGALADAYRRVADARGGVADVLKVQSLNPVALEAHFDFYTALLFGRSELERRTREMIGVVVSAANACAYCVEHHTEPLRAYRVDQEILDALRAGGIPDTLSEPLQALLRFCQDLTVAPTSDPARIDALREHGWSDAAILDATTICCYFNFVNRLVLGLGVTLENQFETLCKPELVSDPSPA